MAGYVALAIEYISLAVESARHASQQMGALAVVQRAEKIAQAVDDHLALRILSQNYHNYALLLCSAAQIYTYIYILQNIRARKTRLAGACG